MSKNVILPQAELPPISEAVKLGTIRPCDIKSNDHGAFRVHVQLLGSEWSQTHRETRSVSEARAK